LALIPIQSLNLTRLEIWKIGETGSEKDVDYALSLSNRINQLDALEDIRGFIEYITSDIVISSLKSMYLRSSLSFLTNYNIFRSCRQLEHLRLNNLHSTLNLHIQQLQCPLKTLDISNSLLSATSINHILNISKESLVVMNLDVISGQTLDGILGTLFQCCNLQCLDIKVSSNIDFAQLVDFVENSADLFCLLINVRLFENVTEELCKTLFMRLYHGHSLANIHLTTGELYQAGFMLEWCNEVVDIYEQDTRFADNMPNFIVDYDMENEQEEDDEDNDFGEDDDNDNDFGQVYDFDDEIEEEIESEGEDFEMQGEENW
jgi:hypothetical protein